MPSEWQIDPPNLRMHSAEFEATLLRGAQSHTFYVQTVRCRTDIAERAAVADNLGEPQILAIAKSASAALAAFLRTC
jgi:hypothetical protein